MKRVKNLFPKLISDENIKHAISDVNKSHRRTRRGLNRTVIWIERTLDDRVKELRQVVLNGFKPSRPKVIVRYDHNAKKYRTITEPKLWPDQYVHHMLIQVLMPIMMRGMDYWCCGSVKGRGCRRGQVGIHRWLTKDPKNTKYCAELDIYHFYDSIKPSVIESAFRSLIKDEIIVDLIKRIVNDGVQIGAYCSQWFANVLLQPLDHYIREVLRIKHYVRYMDNMILFGSNKRKLHEAVRKVSLFVNGLLLRLKPNWQVFRVSSRPVTALGYRYIKHYVMLRKPVFLNLKRKYRRVIKLLQMRNIIAYRMAAGLLSRLSLLARTTTRKIKMTYQKPKLISTMKRIVSFYNRGETNYA